MRTRRARLGTAVLSVLLTVGLGVVVGAPSAMARPAFQMPVPCGQVWTTSTHDGHLSQYMVDMVNTSGDTEGAPALASAAGTVVSSVYDGGAGNMIILDHGDGWRTRYYHLQFRSVGAGATVDQGQQIGAVGNTGGDTTGSHLHYEQRLNGNVVQAEFDGHQLPVNWSYYQHYETSRNCGGTGPGRVTVDTFADAPGYDAPGGGHTGTLNAGTNYVFCRSWGPEVRVGDSVNHWWLRTDLDVGPANQWVSAVYLSRWGNDEAKDNAGVDIVDCNEPYGAIGAKWRALGGVTSAVGPPRFGEADAQRGGRFQEFWAGMVIWHPDSGAAAVYGAILGHYRATESEARWGFPIMDEAAAGSSPGGTTGRYQYMQSGLFMWSPAGGVHVIHGAIHDAFAANGREASLGYPTSEEIAHSDGVGVYQTYQNATIHWTPQQGTWIVR